jgi:hypothetical protein
MGSVTERSDEEVPLEGDRVMPSLPTYTWDSRESVQYEVALEALSQHGAACTDRLAEARRDGDETRAARIVAARDAYIARRGDLRAEDHAGVREVLETARDEQSRILTTL